SPSDLVPSILLNSCAWGRSRSEGESMRRNTCLALLALSIFLSTPAFAAVDFLVAQDNTDNPEYGPWPNHNWNTVNGNNPDRPLGYSLWTTLGDTAGGGIYCEGVSVNGRQVEGNNSFGLFAGTNTSAISRPLVTPIAGLGKFEILTRFDL